MLLRAIVEGQTCRLVGNMVRKSLVNLELYPGLNLVLLRAASRDNALGLGEVFANGLAGDRRWERTAVSKYRETNDIAAGRARERTSSEN